MHCCAGTACGHTTTWIDTTTTTVAGTTTTTTSTASANAASLCASCERPMHAGPLCGKLLFADTFVCHPCHFYYRSRKCHQSQPATASTVSPVVGAGGFVARKRTRTTIITSHVKDEQHHKNNIPNNKRNGNNDDDDDDKKPAAKGKETIPLVVDITTTTNAASSGNSRKRSRLSFSSSLSLADKTTLSPSQGPRQPKRPRISPTKFDFSAAMQQATAAAVSVGDNILTADDVALRGVNQKNTWISSMLAGMDWVRQAVAFALPPVQRSAMQPPAPRRQQEQRGRQSRGNNPSAEKNVAAAAAEQLNLRPNKTRNPPSSYM